MVWSFATNSAGLEFVLYRVSIPLTFGVEFHFNSGTRGGRRNGAISSFRFGVTRVLVNHIDSISLQLHDKNFQLFSSVRARI